MTAAPAIEATRQQDRQHHVHGQTNLRTHGDHGPAAMVVKGSGVRITTDDGRSLIDGFSGLGCVSLGYHND
ncbi:MAG: aspartate aminotransferase family protein, partial [Pseudomonadota bacterium]